MLGLDAPLVVADEGYGQDGAFRLALTERNIAYVVGVRSDTALLAAGVCRTGTPYRGGERRPDIGSGGSAPGRWCWVRGGVRCTR
ncbi:transposase [Streptosporangium sp. NPDC005286]|uniref:transposase n=1 Tax=Streptosporangium sp. NPDC005286 TaxID=3154463 RepID=UPI0033A9012F